MAFFSKTGNILRQMMIKTQTNHEISASTPVAFQVLRFMSSSKVFVGGLPWSIDDQSLANTFSKYGEIVEARVIKDRETGRSRGFGFVTYKTEEDASSAIQAMDGKMLETREIKVNFSNEGQHSFGGGGYGGGGYGGGGYGGGGYGCGYSGGGGGYGGNSGYGGSNGENFGNESSGGNYSDNVGFGNDNFSGSASSNGPAFSSDQFGEDNDQNDYFAKRA